MTYDSQAALSPGALWTHKRRNNRDDLDDLDVRVVELLEDKVRIKNADGTRARWLRIRGFTRDYRFLEHGSD